MSQHLDIIGRVNRPENVDVVSARAIDDLPEIYRILQDNRADSSSADRGATINAVSGIREGTMIIDRSKRSSDSSYRSEVPDMLRQR